MIGDRIRQVREKAALSQDSFAARLSIVTGRSLTRSAVSQWEKGRTEPDLDNLEAITKAFGVPLTWLRHGVEDNRPADANVAPAPPDTKVVPVISSIRAGQWAEVVDAYELGAGLEHIATDLPLSSRAFALIIDGLSMSPDFTPGDKVIIDPGISPQPGDFVVAKLERQAEATFKKYRPRGHDKKGVEIIDLVALNPDWPTLTMDASNPGHVVGTMVEHRRYRRK